jgi:hypothetical protein
VEEAENVAAALSEGAEKLPMLTDSWPAKAEAQPPTNSVLAEMSTPEGVATTEVTKGGDLPPSPPPLFQRLTASPPCDEAKTDEGPKEEFTFPEAPFEVAQEPIPEPATPQADVAGVATTDKSAQEAMPKAFEDQDFLSEKFEEVLLPAEELPHAGILEDLAALPPGVSAPLQSEESSSSRQQDGSFSLQQQTCSAPAPEQLVAPPAPSPPEAARMKPKASCPPPIEPRRRASIHQHRDDRHRASSGRAGRVIVITALLATLTGGGSYLYFTDPQQQSVNSPQQGASTPIVRTEDRMKPDRPSTSISNSHPSSHTEIPSLVPLSPATALASEAAVAATPPMPEDAAHPEESPAAYRVLPGDTLWGIAQRRTGNPFFYRQIAQENAIGNPHLIHPGQIISLP